MKKYSFTFIFLLFISSVFSQNYGVLFIHGLDDDETLFTTYDYTTLTAELKGILGPDTEFRNFGFYTKNGDVITTYPSISQAAQKLKDEWKEADKAKKWFIIGHSMGGLVGKYYMNYLQDGTGVTVKGLVTLDSPHMGVRTLSDGEAATKTKWQTYKGGILAGPAGENPWYLGDILAVLATSIFLPELVPGVAVSTLGKFEVGTTAANTYLGKISDKVDERLNKHFGSLSSRQDVLSLQKGSADLQKLATSTSNFKMLAVSGEELNFAVLRCAGGMPSYKNEKIQNSTYGTLMGHPLITYNEMDFAMWAIPGLNNHFEMGPYHAVGCWLAVREFCSQRADAYLVSEDMYQAAYVLSLGLIGEFKHQKNRARDAKNRYRQSRSQMDRLDWVSQDIVNDLREIKTTVYFTGIDDRWMTECGADYYNPGNQDVGFEKSLPSLLGKNYCDSPVYVTYAQDVYSYEARPNDGVVSLDNQKPALTNTGTTSFVTPTEGSEGYSHFSTLWDYRPWSGKETSSMKRVKDYIKANF